MKAPSDTFSTHCDSWHFLEFSSKMSINQPCLFKIENVQDFSILIKILTYADLIIQYLFVV